LKNTIILFTNKKNKMDSKTKNGLIVLGVVIVLGIVAIKFMKMKKGSTSGGNEGGGNQGGGNQGGGNEGGGGNTSQPLNYKSLADTLFEAMDGYGTNEDSITEVFSYLRNQADFDALENAFGSREISSGAGNVFQKNYKGRLVGALKSELGSSEFSDLNNLLRSKKIKAI
jgi:hypothetical protein